MPETNAPDADVNLKRALEQLGQNEAAVAEAINEARAERSRSEPPITGAALLERIDELATQRSLDGQASLYIAMEILIYEFKNATCLIKKQLAFKSSLCFYLCYS